MNILQRIFGKKKKIESPDEKLERFKKYTDGYVPYATNRTTVKSEDYINPLVDPLYTDPTGFYSTLSDGNPSSDNSHSFDGFDGGSFGGGGASGSWDSPSDSSSNYDSGSIYDSSSSSDSLSSSGDW